jgi:hypothetical protein
MGSRFDFEYDDNPHQFAVGEFAAALDDRLSSDSLERLAEAAWNCPKWVFVSAIDRLIKELVDRVNEPAPDGYFEGRA